jgi:hypothetical protein
VEFGCDIGVFVVFGDESCGGGYGCFDECDGEAL